MNKKLRLIIPLVVLVSVFPLFGKEQSPLTLYNKAVDLQESEEWYDASQYFLEVVNINPAFSDAWFRLAECSYKLGEFDLAFQYIEKAEKYEKNNPDIQNLKGMILLAIGKTAEAKDIFNNVLKKYPNDIDAHFGLAEIDLFDGKTSGAEKQYKEALKRQSSNRRALLSLALVAAETDRFTEAENYLRQAMQYYSGEADVHYIAAVIYLMENDYKTAEKYARIAVQIKSNYDKAYELLATILYAQERYYEVIDFCDYLIGRNRNNGSAWYLKGIAQSKLGLNEDAITTWMVGVTVQPQDEIMRMILELYVREYLKLDDYRRVILAKYHLDNAKQYESRYDKAGSLYEYQRTLLVDPNNKKARLEYAKILESNGFYEQYLNQLNFIKDNSEGTLAVKLLDIIEAYTSLLDNTLAKQWNVDPFYLDKTRWNIALFYQEDSANLLHADSNKVAAMAAADVFSGVAITSVKTQVNPVSGFAEAFRKARENKYDYFIVLSFSEGENDVTFESKMYSARTGSEISNDKYYATGNNRFSTVLRRFRNGVLDKLTIRGKILKRNGKTILIDLGKTENIVKDSEFNIIKKGKIKPADSEVGVFYNDDDVVGKLTVTKTGEEVSEAVITYHGFYDQINEGDEVVLVSVPEVEEEKTVEPVPNATEKGEKVSESESEVDGEKFISEIKKSIEQPAIIDLLRSIY